MSQAELHESGRLRILVVDPPRAVQPHVCDLVENLEAGYFARALEEEGARVSIWDGATQPSEPDVNRFDCVAISVEYVTAQAARALAERLLVRGDTPPVVLFGSSAPAVCDVGVDSVQVLRGWDRSSARALVSRLALRATAPTRSGVGQLGSAMRYRTPLDYASGRLWSLRRSVGCPCACAFCGVRSQHPRGWEERSPAAVLAELLELAECQGAKHFWFADENFVGPGPLDQVWVDQVLRAAAQRIPGFRFSVNMRGSDADPQSLGRLHQLGLRRVLLGVESLDPDALARMNKGSGVSESIAAIHAMERLGIEVVPSFVWPDPWLTSAGIISHLRAVEDNGLARYFAATPYIPVPGSPWSERLGIDGYRVGLDPAAWYSAWPSSDARDFALEWHGYQLWADASFSGLRTAVRSGWITATQFEGLASSDAKRLRRELAAMLCETEFALAKLVTQGEDWHDAADDGYRKLADAYREAEPVIARDESRARGSSRPQAR